MSSKKNGIVSGLAWSFAERIFAQLVSTVVTIILARILDPDHYGIISIVTVLIAFLNVFVTSGFGSSLVQKKEADKIDFDTAFLLSILLSFVLYLVLFFTAPLIADFYKIPLLTAVIRVMGIRLPIAAVNNIQQAYLRRCMEFKRFFWATFIGTVISGVVGVALAYLGFGVWALVVQYLTNVFIDTVMLFILGGWIPKIQFSKESAKSIFSFGWKVLATQLVASLEDNIRSLIVGKVFGSADLAYYDQGKKYPSLLVTNINSSIEKVMLPAYSRKQDERQELVAILRRSIRTGIYLLAPLLLGFAVVSGTFVSLILTDKWLECVPFIQIFCLSYLTRPLESSCQQSLLAIGKSGVVLTCMISVNVIALVGTVLAIFVFESVLIIAVFSLLTTLVSLFVSLLFTRIYLGYSVKMQLCDVVPSLFAASIMGVAVFFVGKLAIPLLLSLVIQIIVGAAVYLLVSVLLRIEPFVDLKNLLLKRLKKQSENT